MVTLPAYEATAAGWRLGDYRSRVVAVSEPADANGRAVAYGPQLSHDELWLVDHMVCSCTSGTDTRLRLYDGHEGAAFLLDGSDRGNFDVGGWEAGLQLAPGSQLLVVWTGATAGAVGTLTLQARVMRPVGG